MGKLIDELRANGTLPPDELEEQSADQERIEKIRSFKQRSFSDIKSKDSGKFFDGWKSAESDWNKYSKYYKSSYNPKGEIGYKVTEKWVSAGGVVVDGLTPEALQMVYIIKPSGTSFGKWTLPKGRQDGTDTLEVTAIREVEEEAGLIARFLPNGYLGVHDGSMSKTHYYMMFRVRESGKGHDFEVERVECLHIDAAIQRMEDSSNKRDAEVLKQAKVKIQAILENLGR